MTSTVTEVTMTFIQSHTYAAVSTTVGIIAILLLVVLLIQKELMRAHGGPRARVGVDVLNPTIAPLLLTCVVILILRYVDILYSSPRPMATPTLRPTSKPTPRTTMSPRTTPTASSLSPAVLLNPDAMHFGRQRVGTTSAVHVVYVVNIGGAPITVTTVAITGLDRRDFAESDRCTDANIGMTGGCAISVSFTPQTTGTRSATLVIVDDAPGSPQTVPLSGQG
jgi:hypothetical protein